MVTHAWSPTIGLSASCWGAWPWCAPRSGDNTTWKSQQATEVHPSVCLLHAFDVHTDDQNVLRTQVHKVRVGELDLDTVVDAFNYRLDNNVHLMRCAPDVQHFVLDARDDADDDASMMAYHGVLAVQWHANQFSAPLDVEHVHELGDHVEDFFTEWHSNIEIATRCKLTSLPW